MKETVNRRIKGEPLQYLLGEWEFYGYPFKVGKGVLIPRPETELLVDLVKEYCIRAKQEISPKDGLCSSEGATVLDLCAGTGCVGISLVKEIGCNVIAVEKYKEAAEYLKSNIKLNNVENNVTIIEDDVLSLKQLLFITEQLSIVVINPPYLSGCEMQSLQAEVRHEPQTALYGGNDGLDFYRAFFNVWGERLQKARLFACEVGDGQAGAVGQLMENVGLRVEKRKDFNGIERVLFSPGAL
ncbi:MAG: peptide chain release factor N(5)-glutamine methyltransferase [Oscillospiraceae bacterium]|nr:peptide chain release factor N(5)-glutamine methyltransferase [Oscillospiraceae bacterium]